MEITPEAKAGPIGLRALLRRAGGLSAASLLSAALGLPTGFLLARWLGTTDYGRAQWVVLAYSYATLLRTGAFDGAVRAFIHHHHRGEHDEATKVQNVGFSVETTASLVPGLILLGAALLADDELRRLGLALAPVAVLASSAAGYLAGLHIARQHFSLVGRLSLARAVAVPALLLGGVAAFGAAAVFVAPIVADTLLVILYAAGSRSLGLRPDRDRTVARRLVRSGFPLGALAVVYWMYRLVGSTAVAFVSTPAVLGVYAFAAAPVTVLARAVAGLQAVVMPSMWGAMAVDEGDRTWVRDGARITRLLAVVAGLATNVGQAAFAPLVHAAVPGFAGAIPVFDILAGNVFLLSLATVPSLVLDAEGVNRQRSHLAIWVGALIVNALANVVVLSVGWGPVAVAWNDLWVQAVVVVVVFEVAAAAQGPGWSRSRTYGELAGIAALTFVVGVCLHAAEVGDRSTGSLVVLAAVRCIAAVAPWVALVAVARASRSPRG